MALVSMGFTLSVTLLDNSGNDTSISYQLRAADQAAASTASATILSRLAAVTQGVISSYRLTQTFEEDALSLPSATAQAEVSASLTAFVDNKGSKKASYRIPMPASGVFISTIGDGANRVNTANANVLSYHNIFEASSGLAYISDGEDAGGLLSGVRVTRSKRGG